MCPEYERVRRAVQRDVWYHERREGDESQTSYHRMPDEARMVKRFARSAAGQEEQLPSDLRPPRVLRRTLHYLISDVGGQAENLGEVHHFIWDRTRAIRNDFSIQQVSKVNDVKLAIECFERIARFHIVSLHQLARAEKPYDEYDPQQEREQLDKTLLSLIQYYSDHAGRLHLQNEAEFRAYQIVFQIQKATPNLEERIQCWGDDIIQDVQVQQALKIYRAACSFHELQGPFKPERPHRVARSNWMAFWKTVDSEETPYLLGCIAEIYFPLLRHTALRAIWYNWKERPRSPSTDWSIRDIQATLGFEDEQVTMEHVEKLGFSTKEVYIDGHYQKMLDLASVAKFPDAHIRQRCSGLVEQKRFSRNLAAVVDNLTVECAWNAGMIDANYVPGFEIFNIEPLPGDPRKPDLTSFEYGFYKHEDNASLFVPEHTPNWFPHSTQTNEEKHKVINENGLETSPTSLLRNEGNAHNGPAPVANSNAAQLQAADQLKKEQMAKEQEELRRLAQAQAKAKADEKKRQQEALEVERMEKERATAQQAEAARLAAEAQEREEEEQRRRQAALEAQRAAAAASAAEAKRKAALEKVEQEHRKDRVFDQLARRLLLEQGGLLDQFVEHACAPLIAAVQTRLEDEAEDAEVKSFRIRMLKTRFGKRWRDFARRNRIRRAGQQRRKRRREGQQEKEKRGAVHRDMRHELEAFRTAQQRNRPHSIGSSTTSSTANGIHHHHDHHQRGADPTDNLSPTSQYTSRAPHHANDSFTSQNSLKSSRNPSHTSPTQTSPPLTKRDPFNGLSYSEYIRQRNSHRSQTPSTDKLTSTYFRLKAMGLDPRPGSTTPYSASNSHARPSTASSNTTTRATSPIQRHKRPRESDSSQLSIQANGFLGPSPSSSRGPSGSTHRLSTDINTTTMPPPPPRKSRRLSDEQAPENTTATTTQSKSNPHHQDDNDLLLAIQKTNEALAEGAQWFRDQVQLMQSESRSVSRRASITSSTSPQWASHPAESRRSRLTSAEYAEGYRDGARAGFTGRSVSRDGGMGGGQLYDPTPPALAPLKYRERVSKFLPRDQYADARRARGASGASGAGTPRRVEREAEATSVAERASRVKDVMAMDGADTAERDVDVLVRRENTRQEKKPVAGLNPFALLADHEADADVDADEETQDTESSGTEDSSVGFTEDDDGGDDDDDDEELEEDEEGEPPQTWHGKGGTSVEDAIEL